MKKIPLTMGVSALVDDEDYERLLKLKWYAKRSADTFYAAHCIWNPRRTVFMHRFLLDAGKGQEVDHRDGNGLNNQRANLRLATHSQNQHNSIRPKTNTTGFKGVSLDRSCGKYRAQLKMNGRKLYIGGFATSKEAAVAYDRLALEHHGEFARLNFPKRSTT